MEPDRYEVEYLGPDYRAHIELCSDHKSALDRVVELEVKEQVTVLRVLKNFETLLDRKGILVHLGQWTLSNLGRIFRD